MSYKSIKSDIQSQSNLQKAQTHSRYFKTGPGEYGEGDIFSGLTVPQSRSIAKRYASLNQNDLQKLMTSQIHEERLIALFILISQFQKGEAAKQKQIFEFYLQHKKHVNNWDLVDTSADKIIGAYLFHTKKDRTLLKRLAKSESLWDRRIAIISTFYFIRQKQFEETLLIAKILLKDEHDLIHKAVGWMLREMGKKDVKNLEVFLDEHAKHMPRTMLRYAIEKMNEKKRKFYLSRPR